MTNKNVSDRESSTFLVHFGVESHHFTIGWRDYSNYSLHDSIPQFIFECLRGLGTNDIRGKKVPSPDGFREE